MTSIALIARFERDDFGRRESRKIAAAVEPTQQRIAELARGNRRAERRQAELGGIETHAAEVATAADMDALDRMHRRRTHRARRAHRSAFTLAPASARLRSS